MENRRSLNRVLRDSLGKGLTKEEVRILARANAMILGITVNLDIINEVDLLALATSQSNISGVFDDNLIMIHDMKYR